MINLSRIGKQAIVLMVIGLCLAATGWAADSHPHKKRLMNEEGSGYQLPMKRVGVEKKMIDAVITNIGDTFSINRETIIVGVDGKQVNIRNMLVPCEAEITYENQKGKRMASRIQITRVHANARWQWVSRLPE